jgi:hypothetical protein
MGVTVSHWDKESKTSHSTVEHIGYVVDIGSAYIGDGDSHYWAVVFNPETGEFDQVGLGYVPWGAKVDAPSDLQGLYNDLKAAENALAQAKSALYRFHIAEVDAAWATQKVSKGKWAKVVKGRKVPKGTVGLVKWEGEGQWGRRALLVTASGEEHWTATSNLEALVESTVETKPLTTEEIMAAWSGVAA